MHWTFFGHSSVFCSFLFLLNTWEVGIASCYLPSKQHVCVWHAKSPSRVYAHDAQLCLYIHDRVRLSLLAKEAVCLARHLLRLDCLTQNEPETGKPDEFLLVPNSYESVPCANNVYPLKANFELLPAQQHIILSVQNFVIVNEHSLS